MERFACLLPPCGPNVSYRRVGAEYPSGLAALATLVDVLLTPLTPSVGHYNAGMQFAGSVNGVYGTQVSLGAVSA